MHDLWFNYKDLHCFSDENQKFLYDKTHINPYAAKVDILIQFRYSSGRGMVE